MPEAPTPRPPEPGWRFLEVLALSALAVAQPLFDLLSGESDFFVAHDATPGDLLLFAVILYLGVPVLIALPSLALTRLSPRAGRVLRIATMAVLAALLVLPPLNRLGVFGVLSIFAALAAGGLFALGLERLRPLRSFVRILALVSLVIPLSFLFYSPVSRLLRSGPVDSLGLAVRQPVPVVMLILDELPLVSLLDADGEIDAVTFPNFARLASLSHWFRNATAVSHVTNYAVPAMLTGRYPDAVRTAIAADYPRSLFTVLGDAYDFAVIEPQTALCPKSLCGTRETLPRRARLRRLLEDSGVVYLHLALPERLAADLPSITGTWADFRSPHGERFAEDSFTNLHLWAADRTHDFDRFLETIVPSERPTLHFLHAMLPHIPWVYLPSGREYWGSLTSSAFAEGVGSDTVWPQDERLVTRGYQRHLLQVAFVDRLLGRLLDRLEQTGLLDEALLIVTSDHGLAFRAGLPGREPQETTWGDVMSVPLFVRTPGQAEPKTSDRNVELIDLLPTIAEVLDVDLPFEIDGRSVFSGKPAGRKIFKIGPDQAIERPADGLSAIEPSLATKTALFEDGLFAIGPYPDLVGRAVGELPQGEAAEMQVRFDQAPHFQDVDPDGGFVPAQIFGRVRWIGEQQAVDPVLALAVNGVIQAVTGTFEARSGLRFAALVAEEAFAPGPNRLDVYLVESYGRERTLRPVANNAAPAYSIERAANGEPFRLRGSDGSLCMLDPAVVDGGWSRLGTGIVGWARGRGGTRPPIIMAFSGERLIHTAPTGSKPPADSPASGVLGFETSGFRFVLPVDLVDSAEQLRLFAIIGAEGSELREAATRED